MTRRTRWIGLLLVTLVTIGVLRELELVELDLFQTRSTVSFSHSPLNLQHLSGSATGRELVESEDGDWTAFLTLSSGSSYAFVVQPRISEIEGPYWAPLYKKGRCTYEFTVDCAALGIRQEGGAGRIELELRGVASAARYRQEVEAIVRDAVEEWLAELRT